MENPLTTQSSSAEMPATSRPRTVDASQLVQPSEPLEPFRTRKTFAIVKVALGSLNIVFASISLGLIADKFATHLIRRSSAPFLYPSLVGASIIWHLTELITLAYRRNWRSIHPGAHVGVHLTLWVLAVLVVSLYSMDLAYKVDYFNIFESCDSAVENGHCWSVFSLQGDANRYIGEMVALVVLSVILLILNFTLFIMACIEMHRRRIYIKKRKVIYLVAVPGMADGRMYYTPPDQLPQGDRGSVFAPQPSYDQQ